MSIIQLKNQFEEIREAKGKLKETVIAKYKNDPLFTETLVFVFSPYFTTGIAKKKMEKKVKAAVGSTFPSELPRFMQWIRENNSGSDQVIGCVQAFIHSQPDETHSFLREVFTQDMQIGATRSTINKVYGKNFIPKHEMQLAKTYADDKDRFTNGEYCINLKIDGYRATIKNLEDIQILSKGGLPFEQLIELEAQLKQLPKGWVYDGELLYTDTNMKSDDRFRKTGSILKKKGEKKDIMFILFDMLPIEEFDAGQSKLVYRDRLKQMQILLEDKEHLNLIQLVPVYYIGTDHSKISHYMKIVMDAGHEGLMLNDMESKYYTERHFGLMKVKKFYTADLRITGYKEYKHPNMLGAFLVDYKGYEASIGGGYTKEQREEFWRDREDYIGKIIEVEYFQESNNQNGNLGIRHGNFVRVRWDKNDVSYS